MTSCLGWDAELRKYDVDVFIHVRFDVVFCGLRMNEIPISQAGGLVRLNRELSKTTLKQSIAYCLCASGNLPRARPGTLLVDNMCGCGTICECAVAAWDGVFAISGDNSELATAKAGANRATLPAKHRGMVDVVQWDSSNLPLRSGVVDHFVVDMPFGKRHGCHTINTRLYPTAMKSMVQCLAPGGKAVLLTSAKALVTREIQRDRQWKKHNFHSINMGGMMVSVFVLGKRYTAAADGVWQQRRPPRGLSEVDEMSMAHAVYRRCLGEAGGRGGRGRCRGGGEDSDGSDDDGDDCYMGGPRNAGSSGGFGVASEYPLHMIRDYNQI